MTLVITLTAWIMTTVIVRARNRPTGDGSFRDGRLRIWCPHHSAARAHGARRSAAHPARGRDGNRDERDRDRGGRAARIAPALLPRRQRGTDLRCPALGRWRGGPPDTALPRRAAPENTKRSADSHRR